MQTSSFQQVLIAALALGLGFSLASSDAVGYPSGPSVSVGANPVVNASGRIMEFGSPTTLVVAPADQDIILTDINLQTPDPTGCEVMLSSNDGVRLVTNWIEGDVRSDGFPGVKLDQSLVSGLRIPAGQDIYVHFGSCDVTKLYYNLRGYYAQP